MRRLLALALLASAGVPSLAADAPLLKLRPVPFTDVRIHDSFWSPRQEVNRTASIPLNFEMLEKSGNLKNLELAASQGHQRVHRAGLHGLGRLQGARSRLLLARHPPRSGAGEATRRHHRQARRGAAADGYLNSYYTVKEPGKRWTNLRDNHELYCAGHMFEAAVAHFQATGKTNFLERRHQAGRSHRLGVRPGQAPGLSAGIRRSSWPWSSSGAPPASSATSSWPASSSRTAAASSSPPNTTRPLDRYDGTYWQDDVPICDHQNIKGHAVRAAYLMSGATDVAARDRRPAPAEDAQPRLAQHHRAQHVHHRRHRPQRLERGLHRSTTTCPTSPPTRKPAPRSRWPSGTIAWPCSTATPASPTSSSARSTTACCPACRWTARGSSM